MQGGGQLPGCWLAGATLAWLPLLCSAVGCAGSGAGVGLHRPGRRASPAALALSLTRACPARACVRADPSFALKRRWDDDVVFRWAALPQTLPPTPTPGRAGLPACLPYLTPLPLPCPWRGVACRVQEPDAGRAQGHQALHQRHHTQRLPPPLPGPIRALGGRRAALQWRGSAAAGWRGPCRACPCLCPQHVAPWLCFPLNMFRCLLLFSAAALPERFPSLWLLARACNPASSYMAMHNACGGPTAGASYATAAHADSG